MRPPPCRVAPRDGPRGEPVRTIPHVLETDESGPAVRSGDRARNRAGHRARRDSAAEAAGAAVHRGLEAWPWPVRIRTFGGLRVFLDGDMITQPRKTAQRPFDLLKAIVAFGSGVREEVLAEALWPESDGDAAHQALATTLHRLRRLVGSEVVLLADRKLSLDPDRC